MTSILPKGIVVNTREISGDIERIDREPLAVEEIAKLWKVYTTTKRRLLDPTAERLENYWWRLWGSRKRNLHGATVARLFAEISDGASFVQLRGPDNRDESGGRPMQVPPLNRGPGTASTTAMQFESESQSSSGALYSSSSKNQSAMPPPILKKSRGPSSSGPRPTARFISPHSSEDEDAGGNSSAASKGAQVIVRPPTPDAQVSKGGKRAETAAGGRRKAHAIGATNSGHKRRPGAVRRPNSDPAGKAHEAARAGASNKEACRSLPGRTDYRKELGKLYNESQDEENSLPSSNSRHDRGTTRKPRATKNGHAKASAGPVLPAKQALNGGFTTALSASVLIGQAGPSGNPKSGDGEQEVFSNENQVSGESLANLGPPDLLLPEAHVKLKGAQEESPVLQSAASKKSAHADPTEFALGLDDKMALNQHPGGEQNPAKGLNFKGSITLAPTYTAAAGHLDFRNTTLPAKRDDRGDVYGSRDREGGSGVLEQRSVFAKRAIQPAKSASALFAISAPPSTDSISRSKSQLTLLLEKDRAKTSEQKRKT